MHRKESEAQVMRHPICVLCSVPLSDDEEVLCEACEESPEDLAELNAEWLAFTGHTKEMN